MTLAQAVREAVSEFAEFYDEEGRVAVPTQFLYPSNDAVTVFVSTGTVGNYRVSDDGGALDQLSIHGLHIDGGDRFLRRICKRRGLSSSDGIILSSFIPMEAIAAVPNITGAAQQTTMSTPPAMRGSVPPFGSFVITVYSITVDGKPMPAVAATSCATRHRAGSYSTTAVSSP